jgi:flagellar biosynthesis/type III secretory pathway ATPase
MIVRHAAGSAHGPTIDVEASIRAILDKHATPQRKWRRDELVEALLELMREYQEEQRWDAVVDHDLEMGTMVE